MKIDFSRILLKTKSIFLNRFCQFASRIPRLFRFGARGVMVVTEVYGMVPSDWYVFKRQALFVLLIKIIWLWTLGTLNIYVSNAKLSWA